MFRMLLVSLVVGSVAPGNDARANSVNLKAKSERVHADSTEPQAPARAESREDVLRRLPPDEIGPLLFPEAFKDLRATFPIHLGMTEAEVRRAIQAHQPPPLKRDRYFLAGRTARNLPEEPFLVVSDGRHELLYLVFFRDGAVESIWCRYGRPGLGFVGPLFVLDGDAKDRRAVRRLFYDPRQDSDGGRE